MFSFWSIIKKAYDVEEFRCSNAVSYNVSSSHMSEWEAFFKYRVYFKIFEIEQILVEYYDCIFYLFTNKLLRLRK